MPDLSRTLLHGALLSLAGSLYVFAILRFNPRLFLQDYPVAIQDLVPPKTERERRLSTFLGIPFLLLLVVVPFVSTLALKSEGTADASFLHLFLNAFGVVFIFNLVDLLLLDWLVFCSITPRFMVIPGTEGSEAYKDYLFHLRASVTGTVLSAVAGLAIAAIVTFI